MYMYLCIVDALDFSRIHFPDYITKSFAGCNFYTDEGGINTYAVVFHLYVRFSTHLSGYHLHQQADHGITIAYYIYSYFMFNLHCDSTCLISGLNYMTPFNDKRNVF